MEESHDQRLPMLDEKIQAASHSLQHYLAEWMKLVGKESGFMLDSIHVAFHDVV